MRGLIFSCLLLLSAIFATPAHAESKVQTDVQIIEAMLIPRWDLTAMESQADPRPQDTAEVANAKAVLKKSVGAYRAKINALAVTYAPWLSAVHELEILRTSIKAQVDKGLAQQIDDEIRIAKLKVKEFYNSPKGTQGEIQILIDRQLLLAHEYNITICVRLLDFALTQAE